MKQSASSKKEAEFYESSKAFVSEADKKLAKSFSKAFTISLSNITNRNLKLHDCPSHQTFLSSPQKLPVPNHLSLPAGLQAVPTSLPKKHPQPRIDFIPLAYLLLPTRAPKAIARHVHLIDNPRKKQLVSANINRNNCSPHGD